MRDLFDIGFDDPAPAPPAPKVEPPSEPPPAKAVACDRPRWNHGNVCRVGGGDACYSDNGGLSWFCRSHRPPGFLPAERVHS